MSEPSSYNGRISSTSNTSICIQSASQASRGKIDEGFVPDRRRFLHNVIVDAENGWQIGPGSWANTDSVVHEHFPFQVIFGLL